MSDKQTSEEQADANRGDVPPGAAEATIQGIVEIGEDCFIMLKCPDYVCVDDWIEDEVRSRGGKATGSKIRLTLEVLEGA